MRRKQPAKRKQPAALPPLQPVTASGANKKQRGCSARGQIGHSTRCDRLEGDRAERTHDRIEHIIEEGGRVLICVAVGVARRLHVKVRNCQCPHLGGVNRKKYTAEHRTEGASDRFPFVSVS